MIDPRPSVPSLRAVTREIDPVEDLLAFASPTDPRVWARRGDVLVGIGEVTRCVAEDAAGWWREVAAAAEVDDPVDLPGTGLIAFGALPFVPGAGTLSVPELVLGRRDGRCFLTRIGRAAPPTAIPYGPPWSAVMGPGVLSASGYEDAVRAGLSAIASGEISKVVLARDLVGTVPAGADLRRLVRALAAAYPDTWTFAVDGLIGASPETLVTVAGGTVTARVLAGTAARGADPDADAAASLALATSEKDLDEHQYAVRSVLTALKPHTTALAAGESPFMLKLPNVWHLATDVEGSLRPETSALDLVAVMHPTAAVAGTPTDAALAVISRIEPFDRGRYAGPVGWIDADGDGEWAIALRCAQFDVHAAGEIPFIAHAGAGIVAGSDPESEMLETRVKFRPIVDALA